MVETQLLGQHEGLADADHRDAEDHVVADLGRLAVAGAAGVDDVLAHALQDRLGAGKGGVAAADHECQGSRLGPHRAAGDRCIDHLEAAISGGCSDFAGRGDIDG